MKILFFVGAFAASVTMATAQLSFSPQLSFLKTFAGGDSYFGVGAKLEYGLGDKTSAYGGFNYYLPKSLDAVAYQNALSSTTSPGQVQVDLTRKQNYMHAFFGAKRYFVGEYDDRDIFGLYGLLELGLMATPVKYSANAEQDADYDITVYEEYEDQKDTYLGLPIGFGLGLELNFDALYFFVDGKLNIPANRAGDGTTVIVVEIPASASVNFGVRIPLD